MEQAVADFIEKYQSYLPQAVIIRPVFSPVSGYVCGMNTRNIGLSVIELKGGRAHPDQKLDYATGFSAFCQIGDYVDSQKPLAFIHAQTVSSSDLLALATISIASPASCSLYPT